MAPTVSFLGLAIHVKPNQTGSGYHTNETSMHYQLIRYPNTVGLEFFGWSASLMVGQINFSLSAATDEGNDGMREGGRKGVGVGRSVGWECGSVPWLSFNVTPEQGLSVKIGEDSQTH